MTANAFAWIGYHLGDVIAVATATPTRGRGPRCPDCGQFRGACSGSGSGGNADTTGLLDGERAAA